MKKKTFKDILKDTPKPKQLTLDERLPSIFDTIWDAKTLRQLYVFAGQSCGRPAFKPEALRMLAEHGYDITNLPPKPAD